MLRGLQELEGYKVRATDGELGVVVDFLVDDERWGVRHLVVETRGVFRGRRVLISPISFDKVDHEARRVDLLLTMAKVENSPSVELDRPVSRQHERGYYGYYGYPYYWGGVGLWGMGWYPGVMPGASYPPYGIPSERPGEPPADVHLRSVKEVTGYHIEGTDGPIGHVADYIVDDETWAMRYMVIDTSNWWLGKRVLVAPEWTTRISWVDRKVYVGMTREAIKRSPPWAEGQPIVQPYEEALYRHYGQVPPQRRGGAGDGATPPTLARSSEGART